MKVRNKRTGHYRLFIVAVALGATMWVSPTVSQQSRQEGVGTYLVQQVVSSPSNFEKKDVGVMGYLVTIESGSDYPDFRIVPYREMSNRQLGDIVENVSLKLSFGPSVSSAKAFSCDGLLVVAYGTFSTTATSYLLTLTHPDHGILGYADSKMVFCS